LANAALLQKAILLILAAFIYFVDPSDILGSVLEGVFNINKVIGEI
tara:strand:+ start:898 stop:1035 length:138 start_codon:yes stop_codon:yes gene_type:complete